MTKPRFSPEYKQLLDSWEWAFLRALVFNRDNYTCQQCGVTILPGQGSKARHLQCDHARYPSRGAPLNRFIAQPLSDYQTLCNTCHSKKTQQSRSRKP